MKTNSIHKMHVFIYLFIHCEHTTIPIPRALFILTKVHENYNILLKILMFISQST